MTPTASEFGLKCAVQTAKMALELDGAVLDFTPKTLGYVEASLNRLHNEGNRSSTHPNTVLAFGGYVGEMLVRNAGGQWTYGRDVPGGFPGDPEMIYVRMPVGGVVNPMGKVAKRLDGDESDNVDVFYKLIASMCGPGGTGLGGGTPVLPRVGPKIGFWRRMFGFK